MQFFSHKHYIDLYKRDSKLFDLKRSLTFLDNFLDESKKIKVTESSKKDIILIDYRNNESYFVNAYKAQTLFDELYSIYYYDFFLNKYKSCQELLKSIEKRLFDEDKKYARLYFTVIISSLKFCVSLTSRIINMKKYLEFFKKGFTFCLVEDSIRLDLIVNSFYPVKICQSENDIKYSCYYGLATLYFIAQRFLVTSTKDYKDFLLNNYSNDIEKYFYFNK